MINNQAAIIHREIAPGTSAKKVNVVLRQEMIRGFWLTHSLNAASLSFMYNVSMSDFRFYHPIIVRYGDLDPQGHVNNAAFLTYLEHARVAYIRQLGLWDGKSFFEIGIILARIELDYKQPILITDQVEIGLRTSRLGNKSLDMKYIVRNAENGTVYAESKTVQVAYDYSQGKTVPISDKWRKILSEFEGLS